MKLKRNLRELYNMTNHKLVIITGPTAVGKTSISIKLAKKIGGEIISADSMQVYRNMNIGTAKIKQEEMQGIPHYLIDCLNPDEEFNVAIFQNMAKKAILEIEKNGHIPIIVGGTAFYIQALLYGIDFSEENHDKKYRNYLYEIAEKEDGAEILYEMLKEKDPEYALTVHMNNVKRVVRALEYLQFTGRKFSIYNEEQRNKHADYRFCYFALNDKRENIYENINKRVDKMMKDGLLEEVTGLKKAGYQRNLVSMQGLGYKEILSYVDNEITLEEAVDVIKRDTRHFAKRQLTWLRRERDIIFIDKDQYGYNEERILDDMYSRIKEMD